MASREVRVFTRCRPLRWRVLAAVASSSTAAGADDAPPIVQYLDEIVVTGSHLRRPATFESPAPLVVLDADHLAAAGAVEVAGVLEDLPINTGSQNNPDAFTQNVTTGTSNVNLRGLGVGSTLVLVNGRRQAPSAAATDRGESFVDLSSLPPSIAFERVEIVKDGASALYGSDAVAGVVNFITRRDVDGVELDVGVQTSAHGARQDRWIEAIAGAGTGRTRLLAALTYLSREPLTTDQRRLSRVEDDTSQAGHPGSFLVPTLPGNPAFQPAWTEAFDGNRNGLADFVEPTLGLPAVPGAEPPVLADQDCAAIAARDPKVVPNLRATRPSPAGPIPIGLCELDFGTFYSIVPAERRARGYVEIAHRPPEGPSASIELHVARSDAVRRNSPSFPFAAFPTVAASHPDNSYGTDVQFIGRIVGAGGAPSLSVHESDTWRLAASVEGRIDPAWTWELGVQTSANDFLVRAPDVLVDRFERAIRGFGGVDCDPASGAPGAGPCAYFNPFGSALTGAGTANAPQLIDELIGEETFDARSSLASVESVLRGKLGTLAGRRIDLAFGAQVRAEALSYDYDDEANRDNYLFFVGNPDFGDQRVVRAAFIEAGVPLGATANLQLAARHEDYGATGSTDPKITLHWRLRPGVALRASAGTAFRAPSLYQSFGTQTTLVELVDPIAGSPQFLPVRTRPNPAGAVLVPETATVLNLGLGWSPRPALTLGIDYWAFEYDNVIVEQSAQALVDAAARGDDGLRAQVIRDAASGLLQRVDAYYVNASELATDGVDLTIAHDFALERGGTLRAGLDATYIASYVLVDPQAGRIDGAGMRNFANFGTSAPRRRANGFVEWRRGRHAVTAFARYISAYIDDEAALGEDPGTYRRIASQITADAQYTLQSRGERTPTVTFGAINLLDARPPHVATSGGYDSKVHDPRGRLWYLRAGWRF